MFIDLFLKLDDDIFASYAAEARLRGTTVEEVLRAVLLKGAGRPYRRPSGKELLKSDRPKLMLDLTAP